MSNKSKNLYCRSSSENLLTNVSKVESEISSKQFSQIALLVANGEISVPKGLSKEQLLTMVQLVRKHRRKRLLEIISKVIADNLTPHN